MVVVLLGITAVTSSAVGLVYRVTEAPIAQAKLHKKADALAQVLPPFDNTPADEMQAVAAGNDSVYVYTARMGQTVAGYAVESFASGFGGPIRIMVGFGPDGRIRNIQVLEQTETPGLGAKLAEEGNPVQASLLGKSPAEVKMSVRKDGGDIDAITASTISSRAYIQAVSLAYRVPRGERSGCFGLGRFERGNIVAAGAGRGSRNVGFGERCYRPERRGGYRLGSDSVGRHGGRNGYGVCFCGCCRRYGFRSHAADGEHRCLVGRHIFLCESCFG